MLPSSLQRHSPSNQQNPIACRLLHCEMGYGIDPAPEKYSLFKKHMRLCIQLATRTFRMIFYTHSIYFHMPVVNHLANRMIDACSRHGVDTTLIASEYSQDWEGRES